MIKFLIIVFLFSACANYVPKGNTPEEQITDEVNYYSGRGQYLIVQLKIDKFLKSYPKSSIDEKIKLKKADILYGQENWESSKEEYEKFLKEYSNNDQKDHVLKNMGNANEQLKIQLSIKNSFNFDIFFGNSIYSTNTVNDLHQSNKIFGRIAPVYYFNNKHGVYFSSSRFSFKAKQNLIPSSGPQHDSFISIANMAIGYKLFAPLSETYYFSYGVGIGMANAPADQTREKYNTPSSLGYEQSINISYCHGKFKTKNSRSCLKGFLPSIGIFHQYSPKLNFGDYDFSGHVLAIAIGLM